MEALLVLIVLFSFLALTTVIQVVQRRKYYKSYEVDREVYRRKDNEKKDAWIAGTQFWRR